MILLGSYVYSTTNTLDIIEAFIAETYVQLVATESNVLLMQGLFVPFARVGSDDPVRVLRLFHNKYTGYN